LIDSIGKLANAYQYGKIAYVGGGFSGSLHNILEPAVFGLPVIFGPKHSRFPEAEVFIQAGIGFSVSNIEELEKTWSFILENIDSITQKARVEVSKSAGATERILEKINLRVE
jgi:3-deoxy-D-manno-octulosonic-acid transferase